jgi:hypothetical protein
VNSVLDPLLLRKSGSAGNRTWTSRSVARNFQQTIRRYITEDNTLGAGLRLMLSENLVMPGIEPGPLDL